MAISFVRVDGRIIHGQIVICWSKKFDCDGIIAVNDKAAQDEIVRKVLQVAASVKTYVWTFDQFVANKEKVVNSDKKYFLITKEPETMAKILVDENTKILNEFLNVGPQSQKAESIHILKETAILLEEVPFYEKIHQKGYGIQFQTVPGDSKVEWKNIREKLVKEDQ
jgi:PTS system mannose-specific IIB component